MRQDDGLRTVFHLEHVKKSRVPIADGLLSTAQMGCDLSVVQATCQQVQQFTLA